MKIGARLAAEGALTAGGPVLDLLLAGRALLQAEERAGLDERAGALLALGILDLAFPFGQARLLLLMRASGPPASVPRVSSPIAIPRWRAKP